jgi:hypothetical protein
MVMRCRTTQENVPIGLPTSSKTIVVFAVAIKLILVWLYSVDSVPNEGNTNKYTPSLPPPNQIYKHVLMPWKTPQCGFLWWSISLLVFAAELCTSFFWGIISIVFFVLLGFYVVCSGNLLFSNVLRPSRVLHPSYLSRPISRPLTKLGHQVVSVWVETKLIPRQATVVPCFSHDGRVAIVVKASNKKDDIRGN